MANINCDLLVAAKLDISGVPISVSQPQFPAGFPGYSYLQSQIALFLAGPPAGWKGVAWLVITDQNTAINNGIRLSGGTTNFLPSPLQTFLPPNTGPFQVSQICLDNLLYSGPPAVPYVYNLHFWNPSGNYIADSNNFPIIAGGKHCINTAGIVIPNRNAVGIWTIIIEKGNGTNFIASAPYRTLNPSASTSDEEIMDLFGQNENPVRVYFEVEPIIHCPDDSNIQLVAEIIDVNGNWIDVNTLPCIPSNAQVRFRASVNPSGATITKYKWNFDDGPPNTIIQTISSANSDTQFHSFQSRNTPYNPTVQVFLGEGCDPLVDSTTVFICKDCPTIDKITIIPKSNSECADPSSGKKASFDFSAIIKNQSSVIGGFNWDFGDGTLTTQSPNTNHDYSNPGNYTVVLTISGGVGCQTSMSQILLKVDLCPSICPIVNSITPNFNPNDCVDTITGKTVTVNFTAAISNQGSVMGGYNWDFGDGTTLNTPTPNASHTYSSVRTFTATLKVKGSSSCPESSNNVSVNIPACPSCPPGHRRDSSGNCVPVTPPSNGGMSFTCWLLLILALLLGIIASIGGIKASCPLFVTGIVAAIIVGIIALGLLVLWLVFCARGSCNIFNWVRWIVIWIMGIAVIVGILVGIFGAGPLCGLLATLILWGYWGTVLAILDVAGPKIGCALNPPPFP